MRRPNRCARCGGPVETKRKYCSTTCRYPPRPTRRRPHPLGKTAARGYGHDHQKLRDEWKTKVDAGGVICWRPNCRRPIRPGERWHLGHDDNDRSKYRGPEHARCNLAAGAKKANRSHRRRDHRVPARQNSVLSVDVSSV